MFIFISKVAIGNQYGQIKLYNGNSYAFMNSFQAHTLSPFGNIFTDSIYEIKQSPFNKKELVATRSNDEIKIWNSLNFPWTFIRSFVRNITDWSSQFSHFEWITDDTIAIGKVEVFIIFTAKKSTSSILI
jgi:hypothetical protein